MEDPDPEWQVIDTLGSLWYYHSLEDGSIMTVGGYLDYDEGVRMYGIFHDDPNYVFFSTDGIGSSAIILIMNIIILN